jgi:hypothetical protein
MALMKCGECGREISDQAAACPGCGAVVPKQSQADGCIPILFVLAIVFVIFIVFVAKNDSSTPRPMDSGVVYYTSTDIVKKFLKAPTTTKFAEPEGKEAGAFCRSNNAWHVWGYVDSQNSFGAMIRDNWSMEAEVNGDDVKCRELSIGGERVY